MPGCAALGCNNRSEKGFMMKCFPRDPVLRQVWKERVSRSDWEPSNNSFLCHMHFETNQWLITPNGRVKLKKGAVPSIFTKTSGRKSSKKRGISESDTGDLEDSYVDYYSNSPLENQSPDLSKRLDGKANCSISSNETASGDKLGNNAVNDPERGGKRNGVDPNEDRLKTEFKNEVDDRLSYDDYLQIEKRLKLVCDGEKYDDLVGNQNCPFEQIDDSDKEETKTETLDQSRFTIKISGMAEDVYEITRSIGGFQSSQSECNGSEFVTSKMVLSCPKQETRNSSDSFSDSGETSDSPNTANEFLFVAELLRKCKDLEAKVEFQSQIINTLSSQSIEHKDVVESMKLLEGEVKRKETELEQLKGKNTSLNKKASLNKNIAKLENQDDEMFLQKVTNRINQLEMTNKQLMKSLNTEVEKRRKAECQVRDRENRIKELKWKLEKAAKFYERSERNTNNYKRKLSSLQTLLRRKKMDDDKKQVFDELSADSCQGSFSKKSLETAMTLLKSCGQRGYVKLLSYNFPLPALELLINPGMNNQGMEVDKEKGNEFPELPSGTVQDIFNESSDAEDTIDVNTFKKYVLTEDNPS